MQIELIPIAGKSPKTGKKVRSKQLRIMADGENIGVLSTNPGASPLINRHFPPDVLHQIEVAVALKAGRPLGKIKQLGPPPKHPIRARVNDL